MVVKTRRGNKQENKQTKGKTNRGNVLMPYLVAGEILLQFVEGGVLWIG